ncbi:hypothetical protein Hanom_Chr13g01234311 [Helianthus anomalus]
MGWDHNFVVLSDLQLFTRVLIAFMLLVICKRGQIYDYLSCFEND